MITTDPFRTSLGPGPGGSWEGFLPKRKQALGPDAVTNNALWEIGQGAMWSGQVALALGKSLQVTSGLMSKLVRKGWIVSRAVYNGTQRRCRYDITEAGRIQLQKVYPAGLEEAA